MSKIKLLYLELDNRWSKGSENNSIELLVGESRDNCQKIKIPMTNEIMDNAQDFFAGMITEAVSDLFEALTGSEEDTIEEAVHKSASELNLETME